MKRISVITPWHNCPELIPAYEAAVQDAGQVIVVDNASDADTQIALREMVERLGGVYIRNETNEGFADANNQGLDRATGEVIVFLNSDVDAGPGWMRSLEYVYPGGLYGPIMRMRYVNGYGLHYLEGWCLIGHADDFRALGGWDKDLPGMYWEDNMLCLRAQRAGMGLHQIALDIRHLERYTTERTPGAADHARDNRERFERMAAEAMESRGIPVWR